MSMDQSTNELLREWEAAVAAADAVKPLIEKEQELRKKVFARIFPNPAEGTNTLELAKGWKIKGAYKIERKIDKALLAAVSEEMRKIEVNPDLLVENEPKLKLAVYRELNDEQRHAFDKCLVIKPGSPTLELVPPKPPK